MTRDDCIRLDSSDALASHREKFALPDGMIYLDGNSLGALPRATVRRLSQTVEREWGQGLIRSWNNARWIEMPRQVGAKIARLIGAHSHEVTCADSTSVNLFKVLAAAIRLQPNARRVIVSEQTNFPTDLYVAQGLVDFIDDRYELRLAGFDEIASAIDEHTAIVMLTHVNYKTGAMHDMTALTRRAHEAGVLIVWDLSHSAGAVPVALNEADADFAVGCGYKYLNGGPGANAFVFAAERHLRALEDDTFAQPLAGWLGHHAPFEFNAAYRPAASIERFTVGTPSILALAALDVGVDTVLAAGIDALRAKSVALTDLFIRLVEQQCAGLGLTLASPRDSSRRGSQVCFAHHDAYPVMQALIERGVIGDFRSPDILRFGFAPLYVRFVDVWDATGALRDVLRQDEWQRSEYQTRAVVT